MTRVLLLGGSGQVGRETQAAAALRSGLELWAPTRAEVDLADPAQVAAAVADSGPAVVINAAAHTAVDRAESEPDAAYAANRDGPASLAQACAAAGAALIHISTDYVFDGTKAGAYVEDDPTAPLGVYGASKEAGERAVRAALDRHFIVRTSWVFSRHGSNFVRTMLRLGAEREELKVVADQTGRPTAASDIAAALLTLTDRIIDGSAEGAWGALHFAGTGATTWHGFATAIFDIRRALTGRAPPTIHPIAAADWPTPARRPANSVLDCRKIAERLGLAVPDWRPALEADVAALLTEAGTAP